MIPKKEIFAELKNILEFCGEPDQFDDHPWTKCLSVRQFILENPEFENQDPGYRLLSALHGLFQEMQPSTPPRRGKRLDTTWGQFGILAALYFAPFKHGLVRPDSLRDAWGRIDQVIPLYVFGKSLDEVPEAALTPFRLVSDENEVAPTSTISGWHVGGLEKLGQSFIDREKLLVAQLREPSVVLHPQPEAPDVEITEAKSQPESKRPSIFGVGLDFYRRVSRWFWLTLGLGLLLFMGWRTYHLAGSYRAFRQDVSQLQAVVSGGELSLEALDEIGLLLKVARADALALQSQVAPFFWTGRLMGWLPVYGGDLSSANDLLGLAAGLLIAGDEGFQAAEPLLASLPTEDQSLSISAVLEMLVMAQPRFKLAESALADALAYRAKIDVERLSPKTRPLLEQIDPYLPLFQDGMDLLNAIPKIMGAAEFGPQTYLIILQNEDELRATGGFITAVATVTIDQGEIIAFKVEDSYAADDLSKIYPRAPWQVQEYMVLGYLLLRDSNWSPDFRVSARWMEHLYAYYSAHSVDGVIAIDQEVIRSLLAVVGPLEIEGAPDPITAKNVVTFMRSSKDQFGDGSAQRKAFMGLLAMALLEKIQAGTDVSWQALGRVIIRALDERHIQVQMDEPAIAALLAARGWDGAVKPGQGDFLMVVDSNLGFNKVNAAAQTEIEYQVDISKPVAPSARLTLVHRNPTKGDAPCLPGPNQVDRDYVELIARCYWDYVRVYTLADTNLLAASPHYTPRNWMLAGRAVPRRVDILDNTGVVEENPEGIQTYGTLLVVPQSEERQTRFDFELPPGVVTAEAEGTWRYQLYVRKQAGTLKVPLMLQVRLPKGAEILSAVPEGVFQDGVWQADVTLRTDIEFTLIWRVP